jgi:hypothetical protein
MIIFGVVLLFCGVIGAWWFRLQITRDVSRERALPPARPGLFLLGNGIGYEIITSPYIPADTILIAPRSVLDNMRLDSPIIKSHLLDWDISRYRIMSDLRISMSVVRSEDAKNIIKITGI